MEVIDFFPLNFGCMQHCLEKYLSIDLIDGVLKYEMKMRRRKIFFKKVVKMTSIHQWALKEHTTIYFHGVVCNVKELTKDTLNPSPQLKYLDSKEDLDTAH